MKLRARFYLGLTLFLPLAISAANWPAWRGPLGTGIRETLNKAKFSNLSVC